MDKANNQNQAGVEQVQVQSQNKVPKKKRKTNKRKMIGKPKLPFLNIPDTPLVSTTQSLFPVLDIEGDIVLFRDGGAAIVMESTSLNFGLLSDEEQYAVISAYAAFINSLSFPIQILVRTQRKDISGYLEFLVQAAPKIQNMKLHGIMQGYIKFLSETIQKKNVLEKKFYVVVPFSPYELGVTKSSFVGIVKKQTKIPFSREYVVKKAEIALFPRRDHLIRQIGRLGLKLRPLSGEEIVELYWDCLNPDLVNMKKEEETDAKPKQQPKQQA
jgi:hypothetical protein